MQNDCNTSNSCTRSSQRACAREVFAQLCLQDIAACLENDKLPLALVADLQEGLAGHVLNARVHLVHELKQLIDHCLQEFPVIPQKSRILSHHIPAEDGTCQYLSKN